MSAIRSLILWKKLEIARAQGWIMRVALSHSPLNRDPRFKAHNNGELLCRRISVPFDRGGEHIWKRSRLNTQTLTLLPVIYPGGGVTT